LISALKLKVLASSVFGSSVAVVSGFVSGFGSGFGFLEFRTLP
jgi:ABC-type thiamin/hydroxymethylpyrimidine transport system permease subunit